MKNWSRMLVLLITLCIIFTGCSKEKIQTIIIEEEKEAQAVGMNTKQNDLKKSQYLKEPNIDLSLSIVENIYEINNFDYDSEIEKVPVGWFDDEHIIKWVLPLPEENREERIKGLLTPNYTRALGIGHLKQSFNEEGKSSFVGYLEKYNYKTGEKVDLLNFSTLLDSSKNTFIWGSNNGDQFLILDNHDAIDKSEFEEEHKDWYKRLNKKGQAYIFDIRTMEKKFIADFNVVPYIYGGLVEWSNNGRYVLFLKDLFKDDEKKQITYQLGIYDTVESRFIQYNCQDSFGSEASYLEALRSKPNFTITDGGKLIFGYKWSVTAWGHINDNKLYKLNQREGYELGYNDIIKDIDDTRILYKESGKRNWHDLNLETNENQMILQKTAPFQNLHLISQGDFIVGRSEVNGITGIYLYELRDNEVVNINLVYKLTGNMTVINLRLSSDNKKIVFTVNENEERIKALVIELK